MNSRIYHIVQQLVIVGWLIVLTAIFGAISIFRILCIPFYIICALSENVESLEKYNKEEEARVDKWIKRLSGK